MSIWLRWVRECRAGNQASCIKMLIFGWFGPMFLKELKKLLGPMALVPIPKPWPPPGPESAPLLDANFLREGDLVRAATGDPNPQPNIVPPKEQLKAATEFRAAMESAIKALDVEIKRLQK